MKWILIIFWANSVNYVPMDTQDACLKAAAEVSKVYRSHTACVTQD